MTDELEGGSANYFPLLLDVVGTIKNYFLIEFRELPSGKQFFFIKILD
jgi:hypothetical protein